MRHFISSPAINKSSPSFNRASFNHMPNPVPSTDSSTTTHSIYIYMLLSVVMGKEYRKDECNNLKSNIHRIRINLVCRWEQESEDFASVAVPPPNLPSTSTSARRIVPIYPTRAIRFRFGRARDLLLTSVLRTAVGLQMHLGYNLPLT